MDQPNLPQPAPSPAPPPTPADEPRRHPGVGFLGLAIAAGGGFWLWNTHAFLQRASTVEGQVTGYQEKRENDGVMYAAMISFKTPDARQVDFTSKVSASYRGYEVGASVPIVYDPQNPDKAAIRSFVQLWLFPGLAAGIGLLLAAAGFFLKLKTPSSSLPSMPPSRSL